MLEAIKEAIVRACMNRYGVEPVVELELTDEAHGDFTTTIALRLAKEVGQSPHKIAQNIVELLDGHEALASVAIAGPGFINFTLNDTALTQLLGEKVPQPLHGLQYLVEYSDPNPFKPLHAGHLYTTIVGDVLARLVEQAGAETTRLNYGGDVGLHVGKTMWAMMRLLQGEDVAALQSIEDSALPAWLGARYAEGHLAYEEDEQAKAEIIAVNKKVYMLHSTGDTETAFAQLYWYAREKSYAFFVQLYEQLQIEPFDRFIPESEVTPLGVQTVQEQLEKDVFEHSKGAVVFNGEKYGLHTRVFISSEGLPTYETKDVGLSLTKWRDYTFDQSIIITANEQAPYMQVVLKAIEQFEPEASRRTKHLTHGIVKLSGGVKMSSRLGNIVSAQDILDAAVEAGKQSGQAASYEIVLAAVKYAFLKHRIGSDIVYDPAESVALEGNSGPYIQYAHARAKSIIRKYDTSKGEPKILDQYDSAERSLVRKIAEYNAVVQRARTEFAPHHICTYLYELAQTFNRFYEATKVLGSERESHRVALVSLYADTLKKGLHTLGIQAPESM
jgi:arginyl-tRNA synthetase